MDVLIALMTVGVMVSSWRLIAAFIRRGGNHWAVAHFAGALLFFVPTTFYLVAFVPPEDGAVGPVRAALSVLVFVPIGISGAWPYWFWGKVMGARGTEQAPAKEKAPEREQPAPDKKTNKAPSAPQADRKPESGTEMTFSLKQTAEMVLADDVVDQREAELLLGLLGQQDAAQLDPIARELHQKLVTSLDDGVLDNDEAEDIKAILSEICDRPAARPEKPAAKTKAQDTTQKKKREQPAPAETGSSARPKAGTSRKLESGDLVAFTYTDAEGNSSDREMDFRSGSKKNGVVYLKGICRSRRAFRTFREDRMDLPVFADTGELILDVEKAIR